MEDDNPKLTELVKTLKKINCETQYIKSVLKTKKDGPFYYIMLVDKIKDVTSIKELKDRDVIDSDMNHSFIFTGKNIKFNDGKIKMIETFDNEAFCPATYYWDFIIMDNKEEIEKEVLAYAIDGNYKTKPSF